jgi:hypothetical protein
MSACRVLTPWFPQHSSILVDYFSFAVLSIILCSNHGRRDTPWCKERRRSRSHSQRQSVAGQYPRKRIQIQAILMLSTKWPNQIAHA